MIEFFEVRQFRRPGTRRPGFAVCQSWDGEAIVAYKSRALAERSATGHTRALFGAAEERDYRRTAALAYLARRAARPSVVDAQLTLF